MIGFLIGFAIALIVLGGAYAASESAIATAPRALLAELADETGSSSLRRIADEPARHAAASSFLRVASEAAAAACVAILLDRWLPEWWMALLLTVVLMLVVSFLLVGSSPRLLGRNHPTAVLRWTSGIVAGASWLIGPIGVSLSRIGGRVASGVPGADMAPEQYFLNVVDKASETDVLEEEERDLIHQVVEFGDTIVREVMVPRTDMVTVDADATLGEAMGAFLSRGVSRVPVIGDDVDDVRGVLYLRTAARILYERGDDAADSSLDDILKPALFVPESLPVDDALRLMQAQSMHILIVVDEYGGVAGLATMEDVIEELLGAISDESDRDVDEIEDLGGSRYRVSARLGLDELGELFDIEIDDDDVDSVGGLFQKAYGMLATASAAVTIAGLHIVAESVDAQSGRILTLVVAVSDGQDENVEHGSSQGTERAAVDEAAAKATAKAERKAAARRAKRQAENDQGNDND